MLSTVGSFVVDGPVVRPARIEVDVHRGLPGFAIVGLPETTVSHTRERVRAALVAGGFEFPLTRVIVNVAPASLRTAGPALDLAIAAALLAASDQLHWPGLEDVALLGELAFDGAVRPTPDAQAVADAAWRSGVRTLVIPSTTRPLAPPSEPVEILYVNSLLDLAAIARGRPVAANDIRRLLSKTRLSMALVEEGAPGSPEVTCQGMAATFEVKLDPGLILLFECHSPEIEYSGEDEFREDERRLISASFEILRVLCRREGSRPVEVELTGEDREAAEAFARRVIPEVGGE